MLDVLVLAQPRERDSRAGLLHLWRDVHAVGAHLFDLGAFRRLGALGNPTGENVLANLALETGMVFHIVAQQREIRLIGTKDVHLEQGELHALR